VQQRGGVDVAEAIVCAADAQMEASVSARGAGLTERRPRGDVLARVDGGEARERQLGDAPRTAADRDRASVGARAPGEGDPT
jgi:hypothetical protein